MPPGVVIILALVFLGINIARFLQQRTLGYIIAIGGWLVYLVYGFVHNQMLFYLAVVMVIGSPFFRNGPDI